MPNPPDYWSKLDPDTEKRLCNLEDKMTKPTDYWLKPSLNIDERVSVLERRLCRQETYVGIISIFNVLIWLMTILTFMMYSQ